MLGPGPKGVSVSSIAQTTQLMRKREARISIVAAISIIYIVLLNTD